MLADTSARFGHFREVLVAMEGRADANGLVAEIALLRAIRARGDRILQNAGSDHSLTMAVLRNRFLLPGAGIALEITKGDEDALRLIKPTGSAQFGGANAPPPRDGGRHARRAPRFEPPGKGGLYSQMGARHYAPPPWASAVRPAQRRGGVQRQPRRALTSSRPRVGICGRGRGSSTLARRQGVRQHLTSCGRGKTSMTRSKRHRCRDLTHRRVGTYVLTAVRRGGRATTRARLVHGPYAQTVNGSGTPSENVSGTSFRNKGMSSGVGGRAFRAHARSWLPSFAVS